MSKLVLLMSMFYQCDVAINAEMVTYREFDKCIATSRALSAQFLTEGEKARHPGLSPSEQLTMIQNGHRRFRAWEAENEDVVRSLRFLARTRVMGGETA